MKYFFKVLLLGLILTSCNKTEGPGGVSSITGTILKKQINYKSQVVNTIAASDIDVFITYGDDKFYGDDVKTQFNGYFEFNNLHEGTYTIWYYSDDSVNYLNTEDIQIATQVKVGAKQDKDAGQLFTYEHVEYDDGLAIVTGKVMLINYFNSSIIHDPETDIKDSIPAQDYEVYLIYEDDLTYCERVRTNYNGFYMFEGLIPGNYRIFTYSEDVVGGIYEFGQSNPANVIFPGPTPPNGGTYDLVIYEDIVISDDEVITLDEFIVEQE